MKRASTTCPRNKLRRMALTMICIMVLLSFTACGGNSGDAEETPEQVAVSLSGEVKIAYPDKLAYAAGILEGLPEDYQVYRQDDSDAVVRKLASGDADLALLTPEEAARAYAESPSIRVVSPVFVGGYRFVGDRDRIVYADPIDTKNAEVMEIVSEGEDDSAEEEVIYVPSPSMLRKTTLNLMGDREDLESLADGALVLDGGETYTVIERENFWLLRDSLTMYSYCALVNLCQLEAQELSLADKDILVDLDAFWEKATGEPLPSAVLVVNVNFLKDRPGEINTVIRDYEDALDALEAQPYEEGRLVFYGSSNRGKVILATYFDNLLLDSNQRKWIPDDLFYDLTIEDSQTIG